MKDEEQIKVNPDEYMQMMKDTSELLASQQIKDLTVSAMAAQQSNSLVDNVEFWNWMSRNYSQSGIFDSAQNMKNFITENPNNEAWMLKQIQGKDYEWMWMREQRGNIKNIFKKYDAGDTVNRIASDVTETDLLSGSTRELQMKAYTSKTNPHLDNTPTDMTVVSNAEKVSEIESKGYDVQGFKNKDEIIKSRDARMQQIREGTASSTYTVSNVVGKVAKAGAIGFVVGAGIESFVSYKDWKAGKMTDSEYMKEILKSGGNTSITAGGTAGIMIPISKMITHAGMSNIITIPISFIVGAAVDKVVAPCFGKGEYKKILSEARYYQKLEDIYEDMIQSMEYSAEHYYQFVKEMAQQQKNHELMKCKSMEINEKLKDLYDLL